jgi:multidrug transporter EmrE-like cation transporter
MRQKNDIIASIPLTMKAFILGWGMVLLYVVFNSFGSIGLKYQVQQLGHWNFTTPRSYFLYFFTLFSSWKTWMSLGAVAVATAAWIVALGNLELSRAYPVAIGLNLLIVVGISFLTFNEPIGFSKIFGVILILSGVVFLFR